MIIKCNKCGNEIPLTPEEHQSILQQIKTEEIEKAVAKKEKEMQTLFDEKLNNSKLSANNEKEQALSEKEKEIELLKQQLKTQKDGQLSAINNATNEKDKEIIKLKAELKEAENNVENIKLKEEAKYKDENFELTQKISTLQNAIESQTQQFQLQVKNLEDKHKAELQTKDDTIAHYKDLKIRLSTKMVGETLEQHCENEFNKMRAMSFPFATFEKDNDAKDGSKGDYIYREFTEDGTEVLSIMFEMKNENDETATKHKNEDFFKKLDKDRTTKNCEYAILVSMLELDSELYNSGIVDVSYRYPKMYVIRPQLFLSIIGILRNEAMRSIDYKRQLTYAQNQNVDISNFESKLLEFKNKFSKNCENASNNFNKAIADIDKSIQDLTKTRDELVKSMKQLNTANNQLDDLNIKKLTKGNPTMIAMFDKFDKTKSQS